jgi:hypothetical protein
MARAVTFTGKVSVRRGTSARSTSQCSKARDGYAQTGEDSTDPVTVAFRTDGVCHVSQQVESVSRSARQSRSRSAGLWSRTPCAERHAPRVPLQAARRATARHIPTTLPGVAATITTGTERSRSYRLERPAGTNHVSRTRRGLRCGEAEAHFCESTEDAPRSHLARHAWSFHCNALILQTMMSSRIGGWKPKQHTSARRQSVRGR